MTTAPRTSLAQAAADLDARIADSMADTERLLAELESDEAAAAFVAAVPSPMKRYWGVA